MESETRPPQSAPTWVWVTVLVAVVVLATQALLIFIVLDTRSDISSLDDELRAVAQAGGPAVTSPPVTAAAPAPATSAPPATEAPPETADLEAPGTTIASPLIGLASSPAPELSTDAAGLPLFTDNTSPDPAIGTQLGTLGGIEWELGDELEIDLADGTARAIVVFAHWCPSCQELLPQLADWQRETGTDIDVMELVTVASALEEFPDQPADVYLSEQQFPFPVFFDSGNELAARLGVNAFPFWVFVSPEGRVIGRIAGQLPPAQFATLFNDLQVIAAEG